MSSMFKFMWYCILILAASTAAFIISPNATESDRINCRGGKMRVRTEADTHLVDFKSALHDASDNLVHTLEDFVDGQTEYVTVGIDRNIFNKFEGLPLCIPEINRKYKKYIRFQIQDVAGDFTNRGFERIVIAVRDRASQQEHLLNNYLTIVLY